MKTQERTWLTLFVALLLLGLALTGCTGKGQAAEASSSSSKEKEGAIEKKAESEEDEAEEELPPVEVTDLATGEIEAVLRFSANLEAESKVQVFSQASRLVLQLLVEEGAWVRKGQVLLRLQDDEQRSNLARTQSQLNKAEKEYQRQASLFAKELISEQAFNEASYERDQLKLSLADAERELTYTEVRAPISGTITSRQVNLGDTITINQHLFDVVDFNTIVARVYVPEKELPKMRTGQQARIYSSSLGAAARVAKVLRIAPVVDPQTGTVKTTLSIPSNQGLLPGMYVEVELVTDRRTDALLLPKRAVIYDNNQAFVYRLKESMEVERILIESLLADRDFIEPVAGQWAAGDRLVVAGQAGLKNGAKVRLVGSSS
jgi:membrane fusion protein (multidrug efflux system)